MAYTPDFAALLTPGSVFDVGWKDTVGRVQPVELEKAVCPTGSIVGCDPLVCPDSDPFTVAVPPGVHRLIAWVATIETDGEATDRRVAALELRITDQPTAAWEMAVSGDDDPAELEEDGFFGYAVDAGAGALADRVATTALRGWEYEETEERLIDATDWEGPVPGLVSAVTDTATGANVVIVGTGWGDGVYPTFIGRDAEGAVTRLVTDFLLIAGPDED
ncbi:DUF4241 domain-containing protein [Glycomyces paridis]|uniref:DUF4241 domain-containing protein n=1 Tax=Glycomyces paridis TaxID=2126555 RepID=A0A4S8PA67_9ACTN|nr:DUF4241 domain-containing protein [Glycomyces paridis]THV26455.1 DUF4241 domain-containing protein [Glycomyces paridis]